MTIFETLKRLQRMPRIHRIAHLQGLLRNEKPRSQRYAELWSALRREVLMQVKSEIGSPRQKRLPESGAVTPASETAA